MNRTTLLAGLASLLIAGSAGLALAQDNPAPPAPGTPPPAAAGTMTHGSWHRHMHGERGPHGRHGMHGRRAGAAFAVIGDLRQLEHLYMRSGKASQLPALYNEVLGKTQDPFVRDYAYRHLARAQMRPSNPDQAIATLRKSLDENLARLGKDTSAPARR